MPIIHDTFQVMIGTQRNTVEHDYFEPATVAEALEEMGETEVLKLLHWVMRLEARSKKRQQFVVTFKPIGRGGTTGPRGK